MSEATYDLGAIFDEHVADFYGKYFVGHWPEDTTITPVSRTVGTDQVVDEMIMSSTHDIPMDTFLPGVAPTGRPARLPVTGAIQAEKVLDKEIPANRLLGRARR